MEKINILGINISLYDRNDVLAKIELFLSTNKQIFIITPNPEFILEAQKNEEFFYILNKADLAIPDGVGLKFAGFLLGHNIKRISGADLVKDILAILKKNKLKAVILNWRQSISSMEEINHAIKLRYPSLSYMVKSINKEGSDAPFIEINKFKPDILFVTLGSPAQEKLIYHNLAKMPSVKIGMGVGGSFDFLTNKIKRAPKILRIIGLEWLWRLAIEPWRWRRIVNAVIIFPLQFLKWRFILPFLYRPNVACLLFKRVDYNNKILLVERKNEPNHWQLPQGGTDGNDIKTAGIRELQEELGTDKFIPMSYYNYLYRYKFGNFMGKYDVLARKAAGYKGQKQGLLIAEFKGEDKDIKINYYEHSAWKWVDVKNLMNEVHPIRIKATKIYLNKFNESIK